VIKLLLGAVAVAGLIAACSRRGPASNSSHDVQAAQAAQPDLQREVLPQPCRTLLPAQRRLRPGMQCTDPSG
jgi:hypothetical protein